MLNPTSVANYNLKKNSRLIFVSKKISVQTTGRFRIRDNNSDLDGCKVISNACCLRQG